MRHGTGEYKWSDGDKCYIGEWVENNMHGRGVLTYADGRCYEGEFENDERHGYGTYNYGDGRIYEG